MGFGSILGGLLKGKALATVIVGTALVGGASVAAATPAGQQVMQSTVIGSHATPGATNAGNDHKNAVGAKGCPGQV
ncbi:MAG: hypothetical protein J2P36_31805, partial [Ktedonobacteraceae bacterium]|nr:hypothetical protein [Ktedonobacteraceae bacterium]